MRNSTQARLAALLKGKDDTLAQVHALHAALKAASSRTENHREQFGPACANQLSRLAQGGTGAVIVMGERVRVEKGGTRSYNRSDRFAISVGALKGVAIFLPGQFRRAQDDLRKVARVR